MKKSLTKTEVKLLDKFAAAALQGLLANGEENHFTDTAKRAYIMAEYMLTARKKTIKTIQRGE
jgi:hypothetical protein